jgi:hypothetical protein
MNTIIDTIQPQPKKPIAYYDKIQRNLFDFEDIRLTDKSIEFYVNLTDDKYTVALYTTEAKEYFKEVANILNSVNRNHNFLYNILTSEQHNQFEKFFNQFKNEELDGTYWICGSEGGDCGEYMLFEDEMLDNMKQSNTEEPNDDKKAFMELLEMVGDICEARDIDTLFLSF